MEKTVKGATKIKLAPPKSKYVEAILAATSGGEIGVAEVFRTLQHRLRDSTWTIAFKSLIVVHLMIREGEPDATLSYLAENPRLLAISSFTEVQIQGGNIKSYDSYLLERAKAFRDTKTDHVRAGVGRLKRLTVDKGLLRETECVQHQIRACLRCDLLSTESDNEITLTAFRLLTMDLLVLFSVMNEGTINVLEHYFEMSRPDAERALNIYKTFAKQTDQVVQYLSIARQYELSTRLEIPKLKHAPTSLTNSLEEYLNDPDFDINRRQYLAQQQAKSSGKPKSSAIMTDQTSKTPNMNTAFPDTKANVAPPPSKGPAPDLIDFFESIEQNQQPLGQQSQNQGFNNGYQQSQQQQQQQPQQQYYQTTGFGQQQNPFPSQQTGLQQQQTGFQSSNPFGQPQAFEQAHQQQQVQQPQPLQHDFTGAGFGGYTPQPQSQSFQSSLGSIPQDSAVAFQQQNLTGANPQQSTNPFRQSMMPNQLSGASQFALASSPSTRQSTNPFAKNHTGQQMGQPFGSNTPFTSPPPSGQYTQPGQQESVAQSSPAMLMPQRTGTNPFAKSPPAQSNLTGQPAVNPLRPNPTGSTNPFRQSTFVNQQTGQAWQQSIPQGTLGGYSIDQMPTNSLFPRPGQTT